MNTEVALLSAGLRYERLESWARERFPGIEQIEFRWSGQVMEPVDALAFIGKNPLARTGRRPSRRLPIRGPERDFC
ncbi:MAG TPA: hypothetical protein VMS76_00075 [Planctomycetota bacterium]|nr:hypothetical protein [Planctomycetota bacterium]